MAFTKTGSPSTILKVAETENVDDEKVLKVVADRPEFPEPPHAAEEDNGEQPKLGGTI